MKKKRPCSMISTRLLLMIGQSSSILASTWMASQFSPSFWESKLIGPFTRHDCIFGELFFVCAILYTVVNRDFVKSMKSCTYRYDPPKE